MGQQNSSNKTGQQKHITQVLLNTTPKELNTRSIEPSNNKQNDTKRKNSQPSDTMDKLDGIISTSEDGNTAPNSPSKKVTNIYPNNQKKTFMQTISGIFRGSSNTRTGMASPEADHSLTSPPPSLQQSGGQQQHIPNN